MPRALFPWLVATAQPEGGDRHAVKPRAVRADRAVQRALSETVPCVEDDDAEAEPDTESTALEHSDFEDEIPPESEAVTPEIDPLASLATSKGDRADLETDRALPPRFTVIARDGSTIAQFHGIEWALRCLRLTHARAVIRIEDGKPMTTFKWTPEAS